MIEFIASLKDTGKAISFDSEQNAEIKLISPASEAVKIIKLLALAKSSFKVKIEEVL